MNKLFLLVLLLLAAPVFAAGSLTVSSEAFSAGVYVNTNQSVVVLNLSLNTTTGSGGDGRVNITAINVTINSSSEGGTPGNISAIEIRNSTGFPIARNTTMNPATNITFTVFIPGGFTVTTSNATILVAINTSRTATRQVNISVNITANTEIATNETANNITISGNSIRSNGVQIQDLHANATISPRFVDTSVVNQSFVYTLVPTGTDAIRNVLIQLPSGFTNINLTSVTLDGSNTTAHANTTVGNLVNITPNTPTTQRIEVYFTANTSSTSVASTIVNSSLYGSNLSNITTDPTVAGVNVTTQPILNFTNITIVKSTAIVNGTDYWEFNFTLNYTANISSGLIQFQLSNWNTSSGTVLNTTSPSCSGSRCATLRNETNFNTTGKFNVTNDYESLTKGIPVASVAPGNLVTLILRMVIPTGTPSSSNWQATYGFLFRSIP